MARKKDNTRVLIIGDEASIERFGDLNESDDMEIDIVGSVPKAVEMQASGKYSKIILDPTAFGDAELEVLTDNNSTSSKTDEPVSHCPQQIASPEAEILDSVNELYFTLNSEWRFTYLNRRTKEHFRKHTPELLGKDIREMANNPALLAGCEQAMAEEETVQFEVYDSDLLQWFDVTVYPTTQHGITVRMCESTAHKSSDEKLNIFETLAENSPDAIARFGRNMRCNYANTATKHLLGSSSETLVGMNIWDASVPEDIARLWEQTVKEVFSKGEEHRLELLYPLNGKCRWYDVRIVPEFSADGYVESILSISRDISELKQIEENLRESGELINASFENSPIGMALGAMDGTFLRTNASMDKMLGYEPGELAGIHRDSITHPDDIESTHRVYQEILDCGEDSASYEKRYLRKDGGVIWVRVNSRVVRSADGMPLFGVAMIENITDRKQTEEALHESEKRLQIALDAAELGTWAFNLDDNIIECDSRARQIYGLNSRSIRSEELISDIVHPDDVYVIQKAYKAAIDPEGNGRYQVEHRVIHADGNYRWVSVWGQVEFQEECEKRHPLRMIGSSRDITEEKRAKEALATAREDAEKKATELAAIMDAVPAIVFISHDTECRDMTGSRAAHELLGIPKSVNLSKSAPEDQRPRNFTVIKDGVEISPEELPVQRAARGEEIRNYELSLVFEDGEVRTIYGNAVPIYDDGEHLGAIGAFIDITERRRAQEALRESEEQYRDLVNHSPMAIFINRNDKIEFVNAAAVELFGASTPDEILGKSPFDVFHPDSHAMVADRIKRLREKEEPVPLVQEKIVRLDGSVREVESAATPFADRRGHAIQVILHDITERKLAEDALRDSEALAQQQLAEIEFVYKSAQVGLAVLDRNLRYVRINERLAESNGIPAIDHIGKTPREIVPDVADVVEGVANHIFATGEAIVNLELTGTTAAKPGVTRHWLEQWMPIRDDLGQIIGINIAAEEVTERKQAELHQRELLDREHHIAQVLQQAILPPQIPTETLGYRVAVNYCPALREAEIGGDFYDVFELADNKLAVLVGDVAGKGLEAALRVASARYAIRSYAYLDPRPGRVMTLANEALYRDGGDVSKILTAFLAILDPEGGTFTYCLAGHEPPIVRSSTGECEELNIGGLPLGLAQGIEYGQSTRRLDPGDLVVVVTDGITEARSPGPDLFGKDRLIELIKKNGAAPPEEVVIGIMDAATEHAGGQLQDDAAVVAFTPR